MSISNKVCLKISNNPGSRGTPLNVITNYFQLIKRPDMHLLQYRVDFTPEVDHPGVRKALVRVHEPTLGKYIFDGTLLYNTIRLTQVSKHETFPFKKDIVFNDESTLAAGIGLTAKFRWKRRENHV